MTVRPPPGLEEGPWGPARSFLGLEGRDAAWETAAHLILPVPYEATTSFGRGAAEGPDAILEASHHLETYDEELDEDPSRAGIATLPSVSLPDAGPEAAHRALRDLYGRLLETAEGRFPVLLGGEHSVSSAPVLEWRERLASPDFTVLQLDAHTDLRDSFRGTPWSHACVMRRVLDGGVERVVPVGIRSQSREERELIRERGLPSFHASELRREGWVGRVVEALGDPVYVTIDVDFFDPALVPGTGTPEPGGGSWWDALDLLREVFRRRTVVGADVVELAPEPDSHVSEAVAAKLVYKLIAYRGGA